VLGEDGTHLQVWHALVEAQLVVQHHALDAGEGFLAQPGKSREREVFSNA